MDGLQAIDNQIASLEAQIIKLKTRRNSLAPLCRLPVELVVRIFKFVQNSNEHYEDGAYTKSPDELPCETSMSGYDISWSRVMRVCTYLRRSALGARELWAVLNLDARKYQQEWIRICLERAGNVPLTIRSTSLVRPPDNVVTSRFKDVRAAYLIVKSGDRRLERALTEDAPNMYSLQLHFTYIYSLTSDFLGGSCARLTYLALTNVHIEDPPEMPALIRLHVCNPYFVSPQEPLLKLLRHTPRLEILHIAALAPKGDESQDIIKCEISEVHLPFLRIVDAKFVDVRHLYALLHMIPSPRERITLIGFWKPLPRTPTTLITHGVEIHIGVCRRLIQLWHQLAHDNAAFLPNGVATLAPVQRPRMPFRSSDYLMALKFKSDSSSKVDDLGQTKFSFEARFQHLEDAPDVISAYTRHIQSLQVDVSFAANKCFLHHKIPWVDELDSLQNLSLLNITGERGEFSVKAVLTWLGKRAQEGRRVDTVEFLDCAPGIKDDIVPRFYQHRVTRQKLRVMNTVVWNKRDDPSAHEAWLIFR